VESGSLDRIVVNENIRHGKRAQIAAFTRQVPRTGLCLNFLYLRARELL
jgi:hypothetical protein